MKIIGREKLSEFVLKHTNARDWIERWLAEVQGAKWISPQNIKERYRSASFLEKNIVIFNVKGSSYRLEIQVAYNTGIIFIKWVGNHSEYDKRNRNER